MFVCIAYLLCFAACGYVCERGCGCVCLLSSFAMYITVCVSMCNGLQCCCVYLCMRVISMCV